jgi:murein DD-endopeptidase MepM/ murein hydrolase activator NlpD
LKTDSLEKQLDAKSLFLASIKNVVSGEIDAEALDADKPLSEITPPEIIDSLSKEEVKLREMMENQNLDIQAGLSSEESLFQRLNFFTPVRGIITQRFNANIKHYAVDIATAENESVKATLDGTVIQATYSIETGYVLVLQHNNNLISAYKHNSSLLKKVGTFVRAGEGIAIAGDSGELSNGPHLHFEIWYNGTPVNPEDLIRFED